MGCCCRSWAGNDCLGVHLLPHKEVQEALGVTWMGAVTSPSSTAQAAGQQGWVLPASKYGEAFSQDLLGQNGSAGQLPAG